jgi:hypothetical protein
MFAREVPHHLSHTSSLFCFGYFGDSAHILPGLAFAMSCLFYTSCHQWNDRCVLPLLAFMC